ncbi:28S ribosomal protein S24, mitochondrial isoform X1 [Cataglyphis hispanica]|uniref:28S ribosomal protein S24, mitochondrial isoform X1 n=1 Tax=Cataglyphis hispanica TaxID=1086592 RepID=UPI00217FBC03|nr:28S ribosomal protein S24, mitochondrial isoform X1 [Cataglyphis hispanica]
MVLEHARNVLKFISASYIEILPIVQRNLIQRNFHASTVFNKSQSGRYKVTLKRDRPLTYEMANPPHYLAHRKSWNSWNTSNIKDGNRPSETAVEDMFIRQFMKGTWHNLFASEIIIKRQHNIIRIAGIITRSIAPYKIYFLTGYTEELLSYWLQCPIKVELVSTNNKKDVIFKYI